MVEREKLSHEKLLGKVSKLLEPSRELYKEKKIGDRELDEVLGIVHKILEINLKYEIVLSKESDSNSDTLKKLKIYKDFVW